MPRGTRATIAIRPFASFDHSPGMNSPKTWRDSCIARRKRSAVALTSPSASFGGFPASTVRVRTKSSLCCSKRARAFSRRSIRSPPGSDSLARCPARAASIAASASDGEAFGTRATTELSIGVSTSNEAPPFASSQRPCMKIRNVGRPSRVSYAGSKNEERVPSMRDTHRRTPQEPSASRALLAQLHAFREDRGRVFRHHGVDVKSRAPLEPRGLREAGRDLQVPVVLRLLAVARSGVNVVVERRIVQDAIHAAEHVLQDVGQGCAFIVREVLEGHLVGLREDPRLEGEPGGGGREGKEA